MPRTCLTWCKVKTKAEQTIYLLVTISKATKFLLPSSVPAVEPDFPTVCKEVQWMDLHTNSCCSRRRNNKCEKKFNQENQTKAQSQKTQLGALTFVFLFKLPCKMSLHKGGFPCINRKKIT